MLTYWRLPVLAIFLPVLAYGLAPDAVTLTVSADRTDYGQPVLLKATLRSPGPGKVTFYDGATILGIVQVSGGEAVLATPLLPTGDRMLRAYYSGDSTHEPAGSAVVPHIVKAGASLGFHMPLKFGFTAQAVSIVTGDFNGDGHMDFASVDGQSNEIQVFLGDGAGGFHAPITYTTPAVALALAVGDFNGDGHDDIAVAGRYGPGIAILAGNGDGTFQAPVIVAAEISADFLAVGDFNGDGKADLTAVSNSASSVTILLGNGDATFQPPASYPVAISPVSAVIADFNHDGYADVAVAGSGAVSILIGHGDGAFTTAIDYPVGVQNQAFIAADLDGDETPDLVAAGADGLWVLSGNGDGSFAAARRILSGNFNAVVAGDFDGDGREDVAALGAGGNALELLSGDGAGNLQVARTYDVPSGLNALAMGDFNSDRRPDILLAGTAIALMAGGAAPNVVTSVTQSGADAYTATVTNVGDLEAAGPLTIRIALPGGLRPTRLGARTGVATSLG